MRVIGRGRAGGSFAVALAHAGWTVDVVAHPTDPDAAESVAGAASGVDLVLVCVPDPAVATVASAVRPGPAVVAHVAGSLGLDVLAPHERRASIHPVVALPSAELGARRMRSAVMVVAASDPGAIALARSVVDAVGGRPVEVAEDARVLHHAAAVVASNHVVALMGQLERIAELAGVPRDTYLGLARGALEDVAELGAERALTGPVARGDWDALRRHLAELPAEEHDAYLAMARAAATLAGRELPPDLLPPDLLPGS